MEPFNAETLRRGETKTKKWASSTSPCLRVDLPFTVTYRLKENR